MKTSSLAKILLAATILALAACRKEQPAPKISSGSNETSGKSGLFATSPIGLQLQSALFSLSGAPVKSNGQRGTEKSYGCEVITYDTTILPHTKTWDYGSGCIGSDGHFRAGQMTLTYDSSDIRVTHNHMSITTSNFVIDSMQLVGNIAIVNTGFNISHKIYLTETIAMLATSTVSGVIDTVSGAIDYTWVAGENSNPASDWQFKITGGGCQKQSNGIVGCATIQTPLIQNLYTSNCNYFINGTVLMTYTGQANQTTDFGKPGACTGEETTTQGGVPKIGTQSTNDYIFF